MKSFGTSRSSCGSGIGSGTLPTSSGRTSRDRLIVSSSTLTAMSTSTYAPEDSDHDLFSAGAGLQLLTFLVLGQAGILLVDEPDAHLHSSLQRIVVDVLRKASQEPRYSADKYEQPEEPHRMTPGGLSWSRIFNTSVRPSVSSACRVSSGRQRGSLDQAVPLISTTSCATCAPRVISQSQPRASTPVRTCVPRFARISQAIGPRLPTRTRRPLDRPHLVDRRRLVRRPTAARYVHCFAPSERVGSKSQIHGAARCPARFILRSRRRRAETHPCPPRRCGARTNTTPAASGATGPGARAGSVYQPLSSSSKNSW